MALPAAFCRCRRSPPLHGGEAVLIGVGVLLQPVHIGKIALNRLLILGNLLRQRLNDLILQGVPLAEVVGFQEPETLHINVQVHLLPDEGIASAQGLDLRIGKGGLVHVLAGAHRGFGGHDLRNEFLLVLHRLPQVGIEGALSDIAVDMHFLVLVAWRTIRPLRCSRSPGRQGQSRSCRAISRSWTFIPAPILKVLPMSTRT
mgnify:CR=1 FL=1